MLPLHCVFFLSLPGNMRYLSGVLYSSRLTLAAGDDKVCAYGSKVRKLQLLEEVVFLQVR